MSRRRTQPHGYQCNAYVYAFAGGFEVHLAGRRLTLRTQRGPEKPRNHSACRRPTGIGAAGVYKRDCRKIGYANKRDAKLALRTVAAVRREHGDTHRERTVYKCPHCRLYHLTSWPALWKLHKHSGGFASNSHGLSE